MIKRWRAAEPVRLYVYGLLLAVLALLVGYGILTAELVPLWVGLVTAAVMAPGVEAARGRVSPTGQRSGSGGARAARTR